MCNVVKANLEVPQNNYPVTETHTRAMSIMPRKALQEAPATKTSALSTTETLKWDIFNRTSMASADYFRDGILACFEKFMLAPVTLAENA